MGRARKPVARPRHRRNKAETTKKGSDMALHDDVADELAQRTIRALKDLNDTEIEREVADAIGASSPTLQETYLTAMRIRRAEARAKEVLTRIEATIR